MQGFVYMKKTLLIDTKLSLNKLKDIDRVYIGNDCCENKINVKNIKELISFYNNKEKITLLLPFFTDTCFYKLEEILCFIKENVKLKDFEIVFNDWGTFYYLRKYYPKISLVMGRLLTKQKKDPRINIILNNLQEKFKIIKSKDKENKIVFTKKIPASLNDIFSRSSIETDKLFDFLHKNNVSRIEIDNIKTDIKIEKNEKIKVSLYYPCVLLTLTRYCGAFYNKKDTVCNKNCKNTIINLNDNFYIKANALYYKNETLPKQSILKSNNIDRIVYCSL